MPERTVEEFIYEYWDCPKCENKAIRGDEYKCPNCGFPRDNSITFYRKTEEEKIQDEKKIEDFEKGPDWICSFCESLNHQVDSVCKGCGATKEDSQQNYFDELKKRQEKEKVQEEKKNPPPPPKKKGKILYWVLGIISLFIGFICWASGTHVEKYTVKNVNWTRATALERYKWNTQKDWQGELKGDDPQEISRNREIRRYDKVQDGTESYQDTEQYQSGTEEKCTTSYSSTGSGASKKTTSCRDVPVYSTRTVTKTRPRYKDVPVYETKITYRSKSFATIGYFYDKGKDNNPKWPEVRKGTGEDGRSDREGEKLESLMVNLSRTEGDGGPPQIKIEVSENLFKNTYVIGNEMEVDVNRLGAIQFKNKEKEFKEKDYSEKFNKVFANSLN
ncbi:MAG: hypothetical protein KDK36_15870 [Leptospiraceae bacterium]|nr:hypothetical protein [Leptospiraceae bacterium]